MIPHVVCLIFVVVKLVNMVMIEFYVVLHQLLHHQVVGYYLLDMMITHVTAGIHYISKLHFFYHNINC